MSIGAINNNVTTASAVKTTPAASEKAAEKAAETTAASKDTAKETGVIYEKGSSTVNTTYKKQNSAVIAQLKADAEARVSQMRSLVEQMMTKQGTAIGQADDMWKFLASGKFTVSEAAKAQAQKDIAEDGYWGVEQTSDRILDFAKALSGNNPEKADELLAAFKKGYQQATGAWGKELPDISKRTYDAVVDKFDKWKNGTEDKAADAVETE
ncbi:MAG: hypothetical protein NC307_06600 [Roseburia sp.]|nr:hypothetical protein [Roseburia sp.]